MMLYNLLVEIVDLGQAWIQLQLHHCITLEKLFNLFETQFPHL